MSFKDVLKTQQHNIREYGMYIAFVAIVVFFSISTKGLFVSSRNIGNLVNAMSYIAVLAVGMTLVIVIRHIDLSVGYLAGFLGAVAAISLKFWHLPLYATIPLVLGLGLLAGLFTAFLVAQMKIPAFVATLAGWLGFRGALQLATRSTGTIIISDKIFNALGNGFIPDIPGVTFLPGVHKVTLLLGLVAIILFIIGEINNRKKTQAYHFEVLSMNMFILKLVFISVVIAGITWVLAGYQGLSWAAVILVLVVLLYSYITTKTVIGRHIYAVGGNPEAAELNGISVKKITFFVFGSMGLLTALSGILYASWLRSATTIAGAGMEFDAIAAAFVGGVAVAGGVGKVTGSILGALVMASLTNGMNLLGWDISIQYIVRALVLAGAVIFDVQTRKGAK
ncbi:MAG: ABC transporter permease [Chloroflexi bacterium RBG_19FT_COMBO_49_13]|nr:MAG: ABC transporter permease [Chloroflexi bacterium RBG_19FT_COMBO_49_13]